MAQVTMSDVNQEQPTKILKKGSVESLKKYLDELENEYIEKGWDVARHDWDYLEIDKNFLIGSDDEYNKNFNIHITGI